MLKMLDGWKNRIVVIAYVAALVTALATGHDYHQITEGLLAALGYHGTPNDWQIAGVIASNLMAVWGVIDTVIKMVKQRRAGASWTEVFSTPGYAKQAIREGVIPPVPVTPEPEKK